MSEKKEIIIKKNVKTETLTGVITLAALTYPERIAISQEALTDIAPTEKAFEVKAKEDLARAQSYYELAGKQVRTLDIKIVDADGETQTLTSVDELMVYEDGTRLVMEIASDLIGGVKLGNVKLNG